MSVDASVDQICQSDISCSVLSQRSVCSALCGLLLIKIVPLGLFFLLPQIRKYLDVKFVLKGVNQQKRLPWCTSCGSAMLHLWFWKSRLLLTSSLHKHACKAVTNSTKRNSFKFLFFLSKIYGNAFAWKWTIIRHVISDLKISALNFIPLWFCRLVV